MTTKILTTNKCCVDRKNRMEVSGLIREGQITYVNECCVICGILVKKIVRTHIDPEVIEFLHQRLDNCFERSDVQL